MITITIETGNEAFTQGGGREVARILRLLADTYERHSSHEFRDLQLRDVNGNLVGHARYRKPGRKRPRPTKPG